MTSPAPRRYPRNALIAAALAGAVVGFLAAGWYADARAPASFIDCFEDYTLENGATRHSIYAAGKICRERFP